MSDRLAFSGGGVEVIEAPVSSLDPSVDLFFAAGIMDTSAHGYTQLGIYTVQNQAARRELGMTLEARPLESRETTAEVIALLGLTRALQMQRDQPPIELMLNADSQAYELAVAQRAGWATLASGGPLKTLQPPAMPTGVELRVSLQVPRSSSSIVRDAYYANQRFATFAAGSNPFGTWVEAKPGNEPNDEQSMHFAEALRDMGLLARLEGLPSPIRTMVRLRLSRKFLAALRKAGWSREHTRPYGAIYQLADSAPTS